MVTADAVASKLSSRLCTAGAAIPQFSTQNQVPQKIIGKDRVIYHIKILLVVIRTTSKNFENIFSVSGKTCSKF